MSDVRDDSQNCKHGTDKNGPTPGQVHNLEDYCPSDDNKPWHEPVDGALLLDSIRDFLVRFVSLPPGAPEFLSLYSVASHAYEAADILARIIINSPIEECGKSTLLDLLKGLCRRAIKVDDVTPAMIFRLVDQFHPTLLLDEGDTYINWQYRGLLNSGHSRDGKVVRGEKDSQGNYQPFEYSTFSPLVIARIGDFGDRFAPLLSRSIPITLQRAHPEEKIERFRPRLHDRELRVLRKQAARWAEDHIRFLYDPDPKMPEELHGRAADNWRFLIAIADRAGGHWPKMTRRIAVQFSSLPREQAPGVRLLAAIKTVFDTLGVKSIATVDLCQELGKLEDFDEAYKYRGFGKNTRRAGRLLSYSLRNFKTKGGAPITSKTMRIHGGQPVKGFEREQFEDAFARYLPRKGG